MVQDAAPVGETSSVNRRVVITGVGVITSIATGRDAFWDGLAAGWSGAQLVEIPGVGAITACPAPESDAEIRFGRKEARRMDRVGRLAASAAASAMEDAGDLGLARERIGAAVACAHGGMTSLHDGYMAFTQQGPTRLSPFTLPLMLPNTAVSAVARTLGLHGPSASPATACAAGTDAIGFAFREIQAGRADAMVTGGAEAAITPFIVAGYSRLGALSSGSREPRAASRPFDRARDGFVLGEGTGIVILEERDHALTRNARIYAEIVGYGQTCDAAHLTDPDPTGTGPARAIRIALEDAGIPPAAVGYVNAHATSTPSGDIAEARAIVTAGLCNAAVSATKSMIGHTLGAAGGIELVATLMAFARDTLPPTINLDDPELEPAIDHVREARAARVDVAVSTSFGFGGHNATLVAVRGV